MDLKGVERSSVCELERNFEVTKDLEEKLKHSGGQFIKTVALTDCYYDTEKFVLCLNDHWLRKRNGEWELKYRPLDLDVSWRGSGVVSKYLEHYDPNIIKQILRNLFEIKGSKVAANFLENEDAQHRVLDQCLDDLQLSPFARFTTCRTIYHCCDELTVHLDQTDFGCLVGEVEMTADVTRQQSLEEIAAQRFDTFGRKLGVEWTKTPGKLETYLIKNNPDLYQKLLDANVLPKN